MSEQKTDDTSLPGKPKTSQYNKYDKKIEQFIGPIISEETAIVASSQVLMAAFDIAIKKNDEAALIDIADRWLSISALLSKVAEDEEEDVELKTSIGFVHNKNEEEKIGDEPEPPGDDSKSRIKVR